MSLLRARAIENQCYVVAAAQVGQHNKASKSYGHSMVVDPWGDVIGQMSDREGFFVCEIDFDYLDKIRGNMLCINQIYENESPFVSLAGVMGVKKNQKGI